MERTMNRRSSWLCSLAVVASVCGCSDGKLDSNNVKPKQVVQRPDGDAKAVATASSQTRTSTGVDHWEEYTEAPAADWTSHEITIVAVTAAGVPTDKLRVVAHRKDDGTVWFAGDVYEDNDWKELIKVGETAVDRYEIPAGYMTQRTRDLWKHATDDFGAAIQQMQNLGTKSQSVPYGSCDECSGWDWAGVVFSGLGTIGAAAVAAGSCSLSWTGILAPACIGSVAGTIGAGGAYVSSVHTISNCRQVESDEAACKGQAGMIWDKTACACACPDGMEPDGNGGCKQKCPKCPCNIVAENGALTCVQDFKVVDPTFIGPISCSGVYGSGYPYEHSNGDGRYCCPKYIPVEINNAVVCQDKAY
jgi:hypothetical protein